MGLEQVKARPVGSTGGALMGLRLPRMAWASSAEQSSSKGNGQNLTIKHDDDWQRFMIGFDGRF